MDEATLLFFGLLPRFRLTYVSEKTLPATCKESRESLLALEGLVLPALRARVLAANPHHSFRVYGHTWDRTGDASCAHNTSALALHHLVRTGLGIDGVNILVNKLEAATMSERARAGVLPGFDPAGSGYLLGVPPAFSLY